MVTMIGQEEQSSKLITRALIASVRAELLKQSIEKDLERIRAKRKHLRQILKKYGRD